MRIRNALVLLSIYAASVLVAYRFVLPAINQVEIGRWLWALGALIVGSTAHLAWKVHDAKRVEGLSARQEDRVRRVAELLITRLMLLLVATVVVSCVGVIGAAVSDERIRAALVGGATGVMLGNLVLWIHLNLFLQRDLRRFEDQVRAKASASKRGAELAEAIKSIRAKIPGEVAPKDAPGDGGEARRQEGGWPKQGA